MAQKDRTDPSVSRRARECPNAAPAAMPPPTEAREGCSVLVGDACARQLDGGVDGRRPPYRQRTLDVTECGDQQSDGLRSTGTGTGSMLGVSAHDSRQQSASPLTVRWVVGRRLRHRAGVHRPRPQGQSSPLWPQWAAAWPLRAGAAFAHPARAADTRVRI